MRTIKQYLEAAKARKENGEAGFSLVELIVVVVILGVLAAIAIPIFNDIQDTAEQNSLKAATASMASQATANIAAGQAHGVPATQDGITYSVAGTTATAVCVTGTKATVKPDAAKGILTGGITKAGPGCTTPTTPTNP